jgi:two-component system, sensor histidine kinase and response regulator
MSPEQISRVGAYVQFERNLYEQQGMGLGLILAKRLAKLYGGDLTITSKPGQGTTVSVTLQIAD